MTLSDYTAARERLVDQLGSPEELRTRDGRMLRNRPIADIQAAISALDAEWQRSQGNAVARKGRMYFSGEGK